MPAFTVYRFQNACHVTLTLLHSHTRHKTKVPKKNLAPTIKQPSLNEKSAGKMVDEGTKKTLSSIPLLQTKAGPRDKELWVNRLKEEYQALIKVKLSFFLLLLIAYFFNFTAFLDTYLHPDVSKGPRASRNIIHTAQNVVLHT